MNHSFDIDRAVKYGVPQAILLENMLFWLAHNKAFGKNIHEGKVWTFNSVAAYAELFPYWTVDQIRRYFESLEKDGVLIAGNFNKKRYDKTKWHTVADQSLIPHWQISQRRKSQKDLAELPDGNGELAEPIPDINADKNQSSAPLSMHAVFKEPKTARKSKPKTVEHYPEIEPLLNILSENGVKKSTISTNLKALMFNAQEAHGLEFCELALRGRIIQASNKRQPLWLRTFFDPDNGEWMGDCAKLATEQNNKVIAHPSAVTPEMSALMDEMQAEWKKAQ
jgi:hypothetical protein